MFKVDDYIIYKRDVCKVIAINNNSNGISYYQVIPISDESLKIQIPVSNDHGLLRELITKKEVNRIIEAIPNVGVIESSDKLFEHEYKKLLNSNSHEDLVKIIKTAYMRNKQRLDNNKKVGEKDDAYLKKAEELLYNEFAIALGKTYDETKKYVIKTVSELSN